MIRCTALGILLLLAAAARGEEIKVGGDAGWSVQEYAPITAKVGDVLVFEFEKGHTVTKTDNPNCNFADSELLADENGSPFELELTEPGSITIASDVQGQCEAGMNFQVTVQEADDDSADDFAGDESSGGATETEESSGQKGDSGTLEESDLQDAQFLNHGRRHGWGGWGGGPCCGGWCCGGGWWGGDDDWDDDWWGGGDDR